jgi:hypothetical protein
MLLYMRVVQKVKTVWSLKKINEENKKKIFYIITTELKPFFYIIPMKIQAPVVSCDEFLYACIVEICRQVH